MGSPDAAVIWLVPPTPVPHVAGVRRSWNAVTAIGQLQGDSVNFVSVTAGPPPPAGLANRLYVEGRAPDPSVDDELVITESLARDAGLRVGDELPLAFLTAEEVR